MNLIGQTLGQYRIIEPVGAGGMASVYKAYQAGLDRYVAVKVLPPQHALTPGFRERFIREARAVAQLSHPNILPVYDFGIKDDISYFVMKHVPDYTLGHLMGQPMDLDQVCHFIEQVAGALDHAHERGIVHRDIKPSNVLLEGDWLLLADFGLAKIVEGTQVLTATGVTLGTPAYISPEQAEGKPIDHRTDIYSLGIVLYEMVTGRVPYQGETPAGVIIKHIIEPLPLPRSLNPDLPETVERVILKAVAKNPDDRYERAGELAQALRQAVEEAHSYDVASLGISETLAEPTLPVSPSSLTPILTADPEAPTIPPSPRAEPLGTPTARRSTSWLAGRGGLILAGLGLLLLAIVGAIIVFSGETRPTSESPTTLPVTTNEGSADLPTRTPRQPTAIPIPASGVIITTDNAHQVEELARLGRGTITALAVSPDGATLAVAGSLGVWLYDAETMETLGLLEGHTKPVTDIAWSPDGTCLASAGKDSTVRIWDIAAQKEQRTLGGHIGSVASVAWSPDGALLASGGWDDTVRIWDAANGSEQYALTSHTEAVTDLAWSPDGALLASAGRDGTVRLWNTTNGRETGMLEGHAKAVTSVAWSPDGMQLASASEDETVRLWHSSDQVERVALTGHTSYVKSVAWSPDGSRIASGALDRTVRVWDVANGDEVYVLQGHSKPVRGVFWFPDGAQLVSGADDGMVQIWDVSQGTKLRSLAGHVDTVLSVAWSPDGTQLALGNDDGTVRLWDASTGAQMHLLTGHKSEVNSVAWSPDGTQLASAGGAFDRRVLLWDAATGGAPRALEGHSSEVTSVAWSPDGTKLASASWDNTVRIWDASGRLLHVLTGHVDWVLSVAWSPDGARVAAGGKSGTVRIWDAASSEQLDARKSHTDQVMSVAWSPDGSRIASAGRDKVVRIWDVSGEDKSSVWQTSGSMTSLIWSPDGAQLAMVSEFRDNEVRIWDAATGSELQALQGHVDYVKSVAWSPDGSRLATGSQDGTVRVWGIPVTAAGPN